MDRLRPWPGRGVKAELSSSQLWMFRLRRKTRRAASALAGALISPFTFPQWGLGQQGCFRQESGYPHLPRACCVHGTLNPLCHLASKRGQDYSRSLFTEEEIETPRRGAFVQSHTLRIRAYKSHEYGWDLSLACGHTPLGLHLLPLAIPSLIHSSVCVRVWVEGGSGDQIQGRPRTAAVKMPKGLRAANQDDTLL